jgi:putative flavoprotein involved in K+ transport
MFSTVTTAIVGAGAAGLAVSEHLAATGHDHVVLERGGVGESWRSQRWDGFRLNTPNWMSGIPGLRGAFASREEIVSSLEHRARALPVRRWTAVEEVRAHRAGYLVATSSGTLVAQNVVLAGGAQTVPRVPALAGGLSPRLEQLHVADYRRPDALPEGGVLIVGSGQSGVQVAEELLAAGRDVLLATSRVGRIPRRHRARDVMEWWREMGTLDTPVEDAEPRELTSRQPQITGTRGGHTVSLQQLGRDGATLLGRLEALEGARARFGDDLAANVAHGDAVSARVRRRIDAHLEATGQPAVAHADDPAEAPPGDLGSPRGLDLRTAGVSTVIWATGFGADFSWLRVPVLDRRGLPSHEGGVTPAPGLYVVGLPWMTHRSSANLYGVRRDAPRIAARILRGSEVRAAA